MWTTLVFALAIGGLVLHLRWRRCYLRLQEELVRQRQEAASLQQQSQQARSQDQARQGALINSMVEGVLVLDQDGRVRWVNGSLTQSFELRSDIHGRTIMEAFRLHELQALANRATNEGQVLGYELDLPGRVPRRFEVNATALQDESGQSQGLIFVLHDVTRIRQLENTRQEFVANVSHELRTPLSIIKGNVETLLDGAIDDPKMAMRFLQAVKRHADRLTFLIEDLLTISRLESGLVKLNLQPVAIRLVVARVLEDLAPRAAERRVRLDNQVAEGLIALADEERVQQVFFNLIDNAIKYGKADGVASIGARSLAEKRIELWVQDDGPGIPLEDQERIFERFFRVDRARSREQGGTGLGLSIVKHIVQSHGGKVWVRSEAGKGVAFFFTLAQPTGG